MVYATVVVDGRTEDVVGGYQRDKSLIYMLVERGDDFEALHELDGSKAIWEGALHGTAQDRYDKTKPGEIFKYRNKKLRRLTPKELSLVNGNSYTFHVGVG